MVKAPSGELSCMRTGPVKCYLKFDFIRQWHSSGVQVSPAPFLYVDLSPLLLQVSWDREVGWEHLKFA